MTYIKPHNRLTSLKELEDGAILLIDKPYEWTSFDVVRKVQSLVKYSFKTKKLKIGHAGTLDPLATGLLVLCTGKMTKQILGIQNGIKEYTGTIFIGQTTPSFDLETKPQGLFETAHIDKQLMEQTVATFIGEQLQLPPIYSAKLVNGKRAYESARAGETVALQPSTIHVYSFEITRFEMPEVDFIIKCSKGTYIRTMAADLGSRLQSGSYLKVLRRTASEPYHISDARSLNDLEREINAMYTDTDA